MTLGNGLAALLMLGMLVCYAVLAVSVFGYTFDHTATLLGWK